MVRLIVHNSARTCRAFESYKMSTDGEIQGVGLLLANDPRSNKLVVIAPMHDGPAEKAGIQQGDELVAIDGKLTNTMDKDLAGALLRGRAGTSVHLQVYFLPRLQLLSSWCCVLCRTMRAVAAGATCVPRCGRRTTGACEMRVKCRSAGRQPHCRVCPRGRCPPPPSRRPPRPQRRSDR